MTPTGLQIGDMSTWWMTVAVWWWAIMMGIVQSWQLQQAPAAVPAMPVYLEMQPGYVLPAREWSHSQHMAHMQKNVCFGPLECWWVKPADKACWPQMQFMSDDCMERSPKLKQQEATIKKEAAMEQKKKKKKPLKFKLWSIDGVFEKWEKKVAARKKTRKQLMKAATAKAVEKARQEYASVMQTLFHEKSEELHQKRREMQDILDPVKTDKLVGGGGSLVEDVYASSQEEESAGQQYGNESMQGEGPMQIKQEDEEQINIIHACMHACNACMHACMNACMHADMHACMHCND